MSLDVRTIMWLTAVASGTVTLYLLTTVPPVQRQRDHASWFNRGTGLLGLAFLLLCQRDHWPDWATVAIANLSLVGAAHSYHLGMRSIGNGGGPRRSDLVAALGFAGIFIATWLGGATLSQRIAVVSAAMAWWFGSAAWRARRNPDVVGLRAGRLTVAWLALLALLQGLRAVFVTMYAGEVVSLIRSDWAGTASFTIAFMSALVLSIGYLGMARERSEIELERRASIDPLTGLSNRRILFEDGVRQVALHRRYGRPLAMLIIDLDHFKAVNDRHGHLTGDLALQCFATAATQQLRTSDLLARAGGEEFCAVLPETDLAGARIVAERIRVAVQSAVVGAHNPPMTMTCSIGVAVLHAGELTIDGMFNRADTAMYAAKAAGRNRVVLANPVESVELARA